MENINLARKAYSGFAEQAERRASDVDSVRGIDDYQSFFDLLHDDVVLTYNIPENVRWREHRGKAAVIEWATRVAPTMLEDARLDGPLDFVANDEYVVVLGSESYKIKKTGAFTEKKPFVVVLEFREGLIYRDFQIKDMSELVDVYQSL